MLTPHVLADIDKRHISGSTWKELAAEVGLSTHHLRKVVYDWRKQHAPDSSEQPVFSDLKPLPTEALMENYLDVLCDLQEIDQQFDTAQLECNIQLRGDKPIGVVFSGDWHVGNKGTNHRRWRDDCHLIRDEPGVYVVGMGDYGDNFLGVLAGKTINEVLARPEMQARMVRHMIESHLGYKGLAWLTGNHDHWTDILTGLHPLQDLVAEIRNPFLKHGGVAWLTVGREKYKIVLRHKFKGFSSLNKANEQRRLADESGGADVVAVADKHFNHADMGTKAGWDYLWIRPGTYKFFDDFSDRTVGEAKGDPRMPMVIFWPNEHRTHHERDFHHGVEYLQYLRQ